MNIITQATPPAVHSTGTLYKEEQKVELENWVQAGVWLRIKDYQGFKYITHVEYCHPLPRSPTAFTKPFYKYNEEDCTKNQQEQDKFIQGLAEIVEHMALDWIQATTQLGIDSSKTAFWLDL
jgi:hypothetical protein